MNFGHVDWYSFTVPLSSERGIDPRSLNAEMRIRKAVYDANLPVLGDLLWSKDWKPSKGRQGYSGSFTEKQYGIRCFAAEGQRHIFFELSGVACLRVMSAGMLDDLIQENHERTARVDLAIDLDGDLHPIEFVRNNCHAATKTRSEIVSSTGETVYVGSRTSERFMRVYRYNQPHERAHLMRIELEFKGDTAKGIARLIAEDGLATAQVSAHDRYRWSYPVLQSAIEGRRVPRAARTPQALATWMRWLSEAVKPSLLDRWQSGEFDLPQFISELQAEVEK